MKKHLIRAAVVGAALALILVPGAFAKREVIRVGNLFLADNGGISPTKLPRDKQAPISGHLSGEIGTTDGSHPPAVKTFTVDFDKTLQVNAKGLPVCKLHQLVAQSTKAAKRACPDSIVGSGEGEVKVAFPEQASINAKGPIYLFNGGVRGRTTRLLIHTYVSVPAPTAVLVPVEISRINRGHYGLHTVSEIPPIAGGAGSVTKFVITIDRKFTYKGKKQSYLTASCPTGRYYTEGKVEFKGGPTMEIIHALPCTPIG